MKHDNCRETEKQIERLALIDGKVVPYDFFDISSYAYKDYSHKYKHLGKGTIFSVNGVKQATIERFFFFKKI